jgi:hypothetical protein
VQPPFRVGTFGQALARVFACCIGLWARQLAEFGQQCYTLKHKNGYQVYETIKFWEDAKSGSDNSEALADDTVSF